MICTLSPLSSASCSCSTNHCNCPAGSVELIKSHLKREREIEKEVERKERGGQGGQGGEGRGGEERGGKGRGGEGREGEARQGREGKITYHTVLYSLCDLITYQFPVLP